MYSMLKRTAHGFWTQKLYVYVPTVILDEESFHSKEIYWDIMSWIWMNCIFMAFQQKYILEFDLLQSVLPKLVRFIKFKFQKTPLVIKKRFSSPYIEF
jgi:hypothetical protein